MAGPLAEGAREESTTLGGRPALWVRPPSDRAGAVLYLLGGGYEIGSIPAYRRFASLLAVAADDATSFAARVTDAGGHVELGLWPDVTHVWHSLGPDVPEARAAIDEVARFLQAHLG
jgi:acetyl esterase/lipase